MRQASKRLVLLPMGAFILLVLAAVAFELPGEQRFKGAIGYRTSSGSEPCGAIIDRGTTSWRQVTDIPERRDDPADAQLGSKVYLLGGITDFNEDFSRANSSSIMESYDFRTGRWQRLPDLPKRLNHVNVAAWGGDLYVFGGKLDDFRRGLTTTDSWRYDVRGRQWESLPPMPTARSAAGVAVIDDRIYVVGGYARNVPQEAVQSFDPRTRTWREHAPIPTPRDHLGVAAHHGKLYAFGGRGTPLRGLDALERFDPATNRWTRLPKGPYAPAGFSFEATPAGLIAAGGENLREHELFGSVWAYRPKTGGWHRLPSMVRPKHGQGSAYHGGRLYVFGGSTCSGFRPSRSVEALRLPAT